MRKILPLLAFLTAIPAFAKAPPPLPIRGTITAISGATLTLTQTSGAPLTVTLTPSATITDVIPASLSDVKPGAYIGTAAIKQPSGAYRAMELQIFPAAMRGIGLGTRAWNLAPHSTMTNGTIGALTHTTGTVTAANTLTLTVNDGTGRKTVLIPPGIPVVTYIPGTRAQLTPGTHIIFFPAKSPTGALTTPRLQLGQNGLVPPM